MDANKLFLRMLEILNQPLDILFIDEAGFDNFQSLSRGWAPKGFGSIEIKET